MIYKGDIMYQPQGALSQDYKRFKKIGHVVEIRDREDGCYLLLKVTGEDKKASIR